jgi:hypothetical protein
MTNADFPEFLDAFRDLRQVFPTRQTAEEFNRLARLYFEILFAWEIGDVITAAQKLTTSLEHFPKPAQWLAVMPKGVPAWIPELDPDEAREHLDAMRKRYKADPCRCHLCVKAGVNQRLLHYVPDYDDGDPQGQARIGDKIVSRGHWAHGEELRRWYEAQAKFYAMFRAVKLKTMPSEGKPGERASRVVPIGEHIEKKSIYEVHQTPEEE